MAREPRIVAHLGRPETPDETAARKAESSRIHRGSQNFRNLIAALLASFAVVAVVIWGVPHGEAPERPPIDVAAIAADVEETTGHDVLVPEVPDGWLVNAAQLESGEMAAWTIAYVPSETGFLRLAQGFSADETWAAQMLGGAAPRDAMTIEGISWDVYEIADPDANANVSYALGTQAGADHVLVYGSSEPEVAADLAADLTDQIEVLAQSTEEGTTE